MRQKTILQRSLRVVKEEGFGVFLIKLARWFKGQLDPLRLVFYPYAHWRVPQETKKELSVEQAIAFAKNGVGGLIRPSQVVQEITNVANVVTELKPKILVEIGTSKGGTLFVWARLATKTAHIVSVDLPGGENNWAYPHWKESFYKTFVSEGQTIDLIRGDSHSKTTLAEVEKVLSGKSVDFLFIDGDHTYEGVKKDYELYSPLVRKGGVIAFHDIAVHPPATRSEVHVFWAEVKQGKHAQEFIENKDQGWAGIGVIFV